MLGGNHHRIHSYRFPLDILDRHLRLPIGSQEIENLLFSHLGQPSGQSVSEDNGHGHQFRRFVARITEHQSLITRSLFMIVSLFHSDVDVSRLFIDGRDHGARLPIEAHGRVVVPDLLNGFPDDALACGHNTTW